MKEPIEEWPDWYLHERYYNEKHPTLYTSIRMQDEMERRGAIEPKHIRNTSQPDKWDTTSDEYPVRYFIGGLFLLGAVCAPVFTAAVLALCLVMLALGAAWFGLGWGLVSLKKLPLPVMAVIAAAPFVYLAWWVLS